MKTIQLAKGNLDLTARSGLLNTRMAVDKYTNLRLEVDQQLPMRHGVSNSDVLLTSLASHCQGENSFVAAEKWDNPNFYQEAMGIQNIPSESTLRQCLDQFAQPLCQLVDQANEDFLVHSSPNLEPLDTGHIPVDSDVTVLDNGGSHKEGVEITCQHNFGFAPLMTYIGQEGYLMGVELRPGKQPSQKGTLNELLRLLKRARKITDQLLLVRLDSGFDAQQNRLLILEFNEAAEDQASIDFVIKWNPRKSNKKYWVGVAEEIGIWQTIRPGKEEALFSVYVPHLKKGELTLIRRVMKVTIRTSQPDGQMLLKPKVTIEGWWTNTELSDEKILEWYADRGTSEQFHSELKTDLDLERLPSQKFNTNALVLTLGMLAYNILRWIGQVGIENLPQVKRQRIRTIISQLIYVAGQLVRSGRRLTLRIGKRYPHYQRFKDLYEKLSDP